MARFRCGQAIHVLPAIPASIFTLSGTMKLADLQHFERSLESWDIFPDPLISTLTVAAPCAEPAAGSAYFIIQQKRFVAICILTLLLLFTAGLSIQVVIFEAPSCGCLGELRIFESRQNEAISAIARNIVLVGFLSPAILLRQTRRDL